MSKTKNKNRSEIEFVIGENKRLKKEVKQLRRMVEKNSPAQDVEEVTDSEDTHPKVFESTKYCVECGKGKLRTFEIINMAFEECDICHYRKKLT